MTHDFFQVKPVRHYDGAQYPSVYGGGADDGEMEKQTHPLALLLALALAMILTVGLTGCYMRNDYVPETPQPDGGPGDGGPDPDCDDDERRCTDEGDLEVCDEGEWITTICEEYCDETYGPEAYASGCDADAAEPCQCEYDIILGDPDPCYPNDLFCAGESTLVLCDADWREVDCDEYCRETHDGSHEWYSNGCDASNPEDPCQCEYGMIDGFMPECEPGEVICEDARNARVCQDGYEWMAVNCDEYCVEENGPDWFSNGCNASAEDFCQCEYGVLDGEMMECTPDEIGCVDDSTVQTCQDGLFVTQDCDERCRELYGDDSFSDGCDATSPEPCRCVASSSGSGGGDS